MNSRILMVVQGIIRIYVKHYIEGIMLQKE